MELSEMEASESSFASTSYSFATLLQDPSVATDQAAD